MIKVKKNTYDLRGVHDMIDISWASYFGSPQCLSSPHPIPSLHCYC